MRWANPEVDPIADLRQVAGAQFARGIQANGRHPHYLRIWPNEDPLDPPWEREWEITHDARCRATLEYGRDGELSSEYGCDVAEQVSACGLDTLTPYEWFALPPGLYEIEAFREQSWRCSPPYSGAWETGLRVVRQVPQVTVVVSV